MFLSIKNLSQYKIEATDGGLGQVHSFLFDDRHWAIRYLVVDTGTWLPGRKVLIAPSALGKPEAPIDAFPVELTREQIKNSPDIDTENPVSRQKEIELHRYFGWAPYWELGAVDPIATPYTPVVPPTSHESKEEQPDSESKKIEEKVNPHLRSSKEVTGYHIHAEDGEIGHIEDFLVDDVDWVIRYMIVDTKNWLPSKKVIVSPDWIKDISWADKEVVVSAPKEKIKDSPEFDPATPVNSDYETRLYEYYGWSPYWL
jgi:hypothetical protein